MYIHRRYIYIFPGFIVCFAWMRAVQCEEDDKKTEDDIDDELVSTVWLTNVTNHHLICLTSIKDVRPLHYDHKLIDFYNSKTSRANKLDALLLK